METNCKEEAYDEVLSFLNAIETEEPVPNDLEEVANEFANQDCVTFISRKKAFITGAKWQAEQDQETIELAEDHAYLAGAVNEREKMMKEAVEGYVNYYEDSGGILMAEAQVGCPYHNGDKVRIVILPKED